MASTKLDAIYQNSEELKSEIVTSLITLQFRDEREREEAISAFEYWHSRPNTTPNDKLLEVDTESSSGLVGNINRVANNALIISWSPMNSVVNLQIAISCLSTDFSLNKGVKGIPLQIQIDTYEQNIMRDRAFCQIRTFKDKGAERKAREEEKRLRDQKSSYGVVLPVQQSSVFQPASDMVSEPILFTPKAMDEPPAMPYISNTENPQTQCTNDGEVINMVDKDPLIRQNEDNKKIQKTEDNLKHTNGVIGDLVHTEERLSKITKIIEQNRALLARTEIQQPTKRVLFKCMKCEFVVPSKTSLFEHMMNEHKGTLEADHTNITTIKGFIYTLGAQPSRVVARILSLT